MNTKPYFLGMFLLITIALIICYYLIPSNQELALMYLKDKRYDEARTMYEVRFHKGDHRGTTVTPLANLYLQMGRIDDAIKVLETYVEEHPKDESARDKLGTYYQYSQQTGNYLKNLEILTQMHPTVERLRQLSYLYNFDGQYDKQIDVLKRIIKDFQSSEQDHIDLAYLQAERNNYKDAVPVLQQLIAKDPKHVSQPAVEFGFSLLIDNKQEKQAMDLARNYIQAIGGLKAVVLFSSRLRAKNRGDLAMQLMQPYISQIETDHTLLKEYVSIEIDLNKDDEAYVLLNRIYHQRGLQPDLFAFYIELLSRKPNSKLMGEIVDKANLDNLPPHSFMLFAEALLRTGDKDLAKKFAQKVNAQLINSAPTVSALLSIATDDPKADQRIKAILDDAALSERDRLFLANILIINQKKDQAKFALQGAKKLYFNTDMSVYDVTQLYISLGLQEKCLLLLEDARKTQHLTPALSKEFDYSWAMLAASTGHTDEVTQWLEKQPDGDLQLFKDLVYAADQGKAYKLEVVAARRVYQLEKNQESMANYAQALVNTGNYQEALPLLKTLASEKADWTFVYADALDKMGDKKAVGDLWRTQITRYSWNDEQLRSIAFVLLKNGHKKDAETILIRLASKSGPNSPDVKQLIYIWGPRPEPEAIKWLKARASVANEKDRTVWMSYVTGRGSVEQVHDLLEKDFDRVPAPMVDAYLQRVLETKNKERIQEAFTKAVDREASPEHLSKIGLLALNADQADIAEGIFKKILEQHPGQITILKEMGRLTLYKARYTEAKKYFEAYFKAGGDDYQSNFYYGQILVRDKLFKDSLEYYNKAQVQIDNLPENKKSMETDLMEAQILYNQGKTQEAIERYKKLAQTRPSDKGLRLDIAYLLMDAGRYKDAERILSGL